MKINIMKENKKIEDINKIKEDDLEKVSGGAFFSAYSDARYNEAGVIVVGSGDWYNDGYRLANSGEDLTTQLANLAVKYYDITGVPASNIEEIRRAFRTTSEYRDDEDYY